MPTAQNWLSRGKLAFVAMMASFAVLAGGSASASPAIDLTLETTAEGAFKAPTTVHTNSATDVVIQKMIIQPGGSTGWHWHPGVVVLTVQKGTITRVTKVKGSPGCTVETFPEGTSFIKQGTNVLNGYNRGSEPIELWLTYIQPKNTPLRYEVANPGC